MSYTCHSGGCPGSDIEWETQGEQYGVKTIAYSFYNHSQKGKNPRVLTVDELNEGYVMCRKANQSLKRNFDGIQYPYIKNLLARNWFQVKNSEAIFAVIKKFLTNKIVDGGTGWAVQMAVDSDKPVFVYHQDNMAGGWFRYKPVVGFESLRGAIPKLTKDFAGIGTRELKDSGKDAIKSIFQNTFQHE